MIKIIPDRGEPQRGLHLRPKPGILPGAQSNDTIRSALGAPHSAFARTWGHRGPLRTSWRARSCTGAGGRGLLAGPSDRARLARVSLVRSLDLRGGPVLSATICHNLPQSGPEATELAGCSPDPTSRAAQPRTAFGTAGHAYPVGPPCRCALSSSSREAAAQGRPA